MLFTDALLGKNTAKRPPVWLMRQAGRYMHEYQALREKHDFLTLCHTPELVCEVTHLPIDAFGFDAAILFSDILLILEALGFDLQFHDEVGPVIANPLEIGSKLNYDDVVTKLDFVLKGIKLLKSSLKVPLIGFAGAPFTVASYLIEGRSSKDLAKTKQWIKESPETLDAVIDCLADCTIDYLNAQIDAGCDAVQLFDSWAMHLDNDQFFRFVQKPLEKICKKLKKCPVMLFCRGEQIIKLAGLAPTGVSCDWTCDLPKIRKSFPDLVLQGNLNPDILQTNPKQIEQEVQALLTSMKHDPAYIFNLGHGVHKNTPREHVACLVNTVKAYG